MDYVPIITAAAKAAKVSSALLLAICNYESGGLKNVIVKHDGKNDTPSIGVCQIKLETARMLGYRGTQKGLMIPKINAKWAAEYLKYQVNRYGDDDWCKLTAAYNAGSYKPSKIHPGKPVNFIYVCRVRKRLDKNLQHRLSCSKSEE